MVLMSPTGGPSRCYNFFMDFLKVRMRPSHLRRLTRVFYSRRRPESARAPVGGGGNGESKSVRALTPPIFPFNAQTRKPTQCIEDNGDNPPACKAWADDYLECLHHRRYTERKLEVEQERRRQEAAAAGGGHGHGH